MASLTRWTWVWVNSGSWWWTRRPGMLDSWGRKESDTTEQLNWIELRWVQLCGSLNILWHCLSLGLEWKLTFSSPAIYLGPNYGEGNEDNGDLLRSHACTATVRAPNAATGHRQSTPLLEIPRHPQASLLGGHCSFPLGPSAQGSVVPTKSVLPSPM